MPRYCPRCRSQYQEEVQVCWTCRVRLVASLEGEETNREWVDLKPAYFAPDEFSALAVERVLADAEIETKVQSVQIPWVDGIMKNIKGYWGIVLVAEEDLESAREIVTEYIRSIEAHKSDEPDRDDDALGG